MRRASRAVEEEPAVDSRVDLRHAATESEVPPLRPALSREAVRTLRAEAVQAWSAAMGDATSCALAKDGRSYPAGKYHEGRVAALGELMRRLTPDSDAAEAVAVSRELADAWSSRAQPGGGANREWESYRAGGVHVLAELADSSAGTEVRPASTWPRSGRAAIRRDHRRAVR